MPLTYPRVHWRLTHRAFHLRLNCCALVFILWQRASLGAGDFPWTVLVFWLPLISDLLFILYCCTLNWLALVFQLQISDFLCVMPVVVLQLD